MIPLTLAEEIEQLRTVGAIGMRQLGDELGLDLGPPDPAGLSDMALNVAKAVDQAMAEVVEMAKFVGRSAARRRARSLARRLAEELTQELELAVLGAG